MEAFLLQSTKQNGQSFKIKIFFRKVTSFQSILNAKEKPFSGAIQYGVPITEKAPRPRIPLSVKALATLKSHKTAFP